jgi:thiosulfate/3-mercaptopyruvate sulfurtransferase
MTALIDAQTLRKRLLNNENIKLVDATYPPRPGLGIANAAIFDIDAIADLSNPLAHTLPDAETFAAAVGAMGIGNDDEVVIYDQSGIAMAAARAWWMFRVFSHRNIKVLNGGLPRWAEMGFPLVISETVPQTKTYQATYNPTLVVDRHFIADHLNDSNIVIADARPGDRFAATTPEFRAGIASGHIPGSLSLPFSHLIDPATGMLRQHDPRIVSILETNPDRIISTCGSGVTACVLALAFYEENQRDIAVYDGSWAEWGNPELGMPVETGNGRNL